MSDFTLVGALFSHGSTEDENGINLLGVLTDLKIEIFDEITEPDEIGHIPFDCFLFLHFRCKPSEKVRMFNMTYFPEINGFSADKRNSFSS